MATVSLREEATDLLQRLIRLDTVNPPGNETRAAEHLRGYLEASGVACELYAKDPDRANLVARIPGSEHGRRLLLLSHTDTVLADPSEWRLDPSIRDAVNFQEGNLSQGQPSWAPESYDVIFFRNVLMYFDVAARRRVVSTFHRKLVKGGYLLLGHSESLLNLTTAFELVHLRRDMVYRKP